jgi:hypothetical protein
MEQSAGFFGSLKDLLLQAAPYAAFPGIGSAAFAIPQVLSGGRSNNAEIGNSKKDTGLGLDTYYAGENYGYQSPGSFLKVDPTRATDDSGEQARIRAVQDRLRGDIARAKGSSNIPPTDNAGGGSSNPGGGQVVPPADSSGQPKTGTVLPGPVTPGPKQGEEKGPQDIWKEIVKQLDPEVAKQRAAIDTENAVRRMLVTNALSMRQSRENTARQVELKNIEAWKTLEQARIEANTRQTIATAQTIALSLTPNQGFSQALTQAYGAALRPFENTNLK